MKTTAARSLLLVLTLAGAARADWGKDINAGAGPALIEAAAPRLVALVRAPEAERAARSAAYVRDHGLAHLEAWKRCRNPELRPLFYLLAAHPDWKVRHRALYALEYYGGSEVLDLALALLDHEERRLREKAAITCIKLWDGRKPPLILGERLAKETDFHVFQCLVALSKRVKGRLPIERVHQEHVVTRRDGLRLTPFLSGMNNAKQVAPAYAAVAKARQGGGSAVKLPPADRWVHPLMDYGEEVVKGTSLQPFANLRQNGTVYHVGQDVGACMDGAGYYAPAEGIVKLVHSGSDMGTLIVLEHHLGDKQVVNGVYMHGGDTVFVKAGERVACGQLLGTMGMSYSIENGGHFAHLHYGLYPGPFSMTHNYGYRPVKAGLADWYDPEAFFARWVDLTQPLVPDLPLFTDSSFFAKIRTLVEGGQYGKAYAAAQKARADGVAAHGWPDLLPLLEAAPGKALGRVEKLRVAGYPAEAQRQLKAFATACRGIPGAQRLAETLASWAQDDAFKRDLKAEKDFLSTRRRATKARDAEKRRALWQKLLEKHAGTPLEGRIKEQLERAGG